MSGDSDLFVQAVTDRFLTLKGKVPTAITFDMLWPIMPDIVDAIETTYVEGRKLSASEKKQALIDFVNKIIDIPILSEALEGIMIGLAVNMLINGLNRALGHGWAVALGLEDATAVTPK